MPEKGRPPQAIPSPINIHIITCYIRYQGSYTQLYINTLEQAIISVQAKLEVIRRKHIAHPTSFGAYSSTCCKGTDNCAGTMGVDQLPSSTVGLQTLDYANDDKRRSGHIAAFTFHDEFVQRYIGSRWIIGNRDITFNNLIINLYDDMSLTAMLWYSIMPICTAIENTLQYLQFVYWRDNSFFRIIW